MTIIDELTTEEGSGDEPSDAAAAEIPEAPAEPDDTAASGTVGSDGGAGDATNAGDGTANPDVAGDEPKSTAKGKKKGE